MKTTLSLLAVGIALALPVAASAQSAADIAYCKKLAVLWYTYVDTDPSAYQIKPTEDIQLNRFDVGYGSDQTVEAIIRKTEGDANAKFSVVGQNGTVNVPSGSTILMRCALISSNCAG